MKISLSALLLLSILSVTALAFAAPELTVPEASYNFGTIPQGKKVPHNFVIRNSGDAPLQIKEVTVSCGCTAAKPSSSLIAPGKSAEIQVLFDSTNFTGKVQKSVTLVTNAGKSPNYTLYLDGTIVEVLQVSPRQMNLGPVKPGVAKQTTVTITNRESTSVKLLSVNLTSNTLQMKSVIKKGELKSGETGTIELSITPRPDAKIMSGYLHIMTDSAQKKEITIPVYASVAK
jgi:copper(I)-binding protein